MVALMGNVNHSAKALYRRCMLKRKQSRNLVWVDCQHSSRSYADSSAGRAARGVRIRPRGRNNGASEKWYGPEVKWQMSTVTSLSPTMFVSIWTSKSQCQRLPPLIHVHILHGRHKPHYDSLLNVELIADPQWVDSCLLKTSQPPQPVRIRHAPCPMNE